MFNPTGASFEYPAENNDFDSNGYPFDATNSGSSTGAAQTIGFDLDATIADPSTAAAECWWLEPSSNGDSSQYPGSTVLCVPWNGFTDTHNFQTGLAPGDGAVWMDNVDELDALRQRYLNIPERQEPSMAGPSTAIQPALPPSIPPVGLTGPTSTPSPIPALPRGSPTLHSASCIATGSHRSGMYDQPLSQWPHPVSVGKGEARATDQSPPRHSSATGDTTWQYHQPPMPQHDDVGPNPFMDTGVPNTNLPTGVASSSGPQRSKRGATRKGKGIEKGTGRRKRASKETLPPDINWHRTCDRFYWEVIQTYLLQPSGGLPTPEAAYAKIKDFIKEDLHQSPLVVKELGVKSSRDQEQYLTGILNVLYPARGGGKRDVQRLLEQVADEIKRGLFMVNDTVALRDGPSNKAKPEDLDDSAEWVRHRRVEKERRDASHETLGQISFFFKAAPRSLSRNEVLFFAITYLVFGVEAFGDGFVIALPKL